MLTTTCVCIAVAWISTTERTDDYRRAIIADLDTRGSTIAIWRMDNGWWAYAPKSMRPWQSTVQLNKGPVSSDDWKRIDQLNCRIVGLKLGGLEFDDFDLQAIASASSFRTLQDVGFYETNITDEAVHGFQNSFPNCIVHSHKTRLAGMNK